MLQGTPKKILTVFFYKESSNKIPVLAWLKKLPKQIAVLHGFIKKTQKIPEQDLKKAQMRLKKLVII